MFDHKEYVSFYYANSKELATVIPNHNTTALLIVDLQNEFVHLDYGEAKEFKENGEWDRWKPYFDRLHQTVLPNTKRLIDFFRTSSMEVTYGRIASLKKNGTDRSAVQKTPGWNGILIPVDSYGAEIVDPLKPKDDEIVVNKTTDSVLAGTNYVRLLRNMGIETVVVAGIVTDQCVSSTVRGLADEDFKVIVVEDCCASADIELHKAELKIMNIIYCQVMDCQGVIKILESSVNSDNLTT